ncbi:MAG: hypothetical protein LBC65_06025, partial [Oscillospiraceae bacterium]|nr:hypothetical protein [Oscillospiraceae bacterium]
CESLRDDGAYLEAQARELLLGAGFTAERPAIAAQPLESAHRAIAARALIRAAELLGTHLYREQVDGALELLHSGKRGRTIDLPGGFALSRTREAVVFTSPSAQIVHDSFTQND